ncbi:MAG: hypothetical protein M3016_10330 [Actinomycetota bacterium]|nr:hypothetical protein [Actinomycetota bacterium]
MTKRFRRSFGAGPVPVLSLLASFAIAGAAVVGWFGRSKDVVSVLAWFLAAIVLHDLFLLPLYTWLDRMALGRLHDRVHHRVGTRPPEVSPTPFLRVPAMLSGLLLLVFFPVIFGLGQRTEVSATGIPEHGYLARWLLATGVLFALSGVAYILVRARAGGRAPAPEPEPEP